MDHDRLQNRSYSRKRLDQLLAEVVEGLASQGAVELLAAALERLEADLLLEAVERQQTAVAVAQREGLDKVHSLRRTHKCNQQEYLDLSGFFRRLYVPETIPEEDQLLLEADY